MTQGNLAEFDYSSSTDSQPYLIITADCSDPHEIDDGLFVQPLASSKELYRVGVCVADTSKLYDNTDIRKAAMANGSARYWDLGGGERGYDPMIPADAIRELEFKKDKVRDALVLSFLVGRGVVPTEFEVSYGKVQVTTNMTYKQFADRCTSSDYYSKFTTTAELIRSGLGYTPGGDNGGNSARQGHGVGDASGRRWLNGARINEAFMISANHLLGKLMREEDRPAIYRLFDPSDTSYQDILDANVARYSLTPGPHKALRLDPYCRATSPLRRLEDYLMSHQLRQRDRGKPATKNDIEYLSAGTRRLNQEIASHALRSSGILVSRSRGARKHENDSAKMIA